MTMLTQMLPKQDVQYVILFMTTWLIHFSEIKLINKESFLSNFCVIKTE